MDHFPLDSSPEIPISLMLLIVAWNQESGVVNPHRLYYIVPVHNSMLCSVENKKHPLMKTLKS